jgi:transcriptional regulator with XRE-family HTH domain
MTLKELGQEAGLSHPFLSQLERGLARPSMGSVERIAQALDVPAGGLWAHPRLTVREWTSDSHRWPERREVESGEVLVYVVRGKVEIDLDGEVHALAEGDALLFDGRVPHRLRRTGGVRTRALRVAAEL